MKRDQSATNPSQQGRKQAEDSTAHPSGKDLPGSHGKRNPGHVNPAHNTPGHTRQDQPRQQEPEKPGQRQTQSYPGIQGDKTHGLQQDSAIDAQEAEQVKRDLDNKKDTAQDDALDMPKE